MSSRVRYTRRNIISNNFYQLPKFLFDAEFAGLTNDARVLYALLRNRHEISIKNGWFDENDEVFLYFKREDMQSIMKRSDKSVTRAMNELKKLGLLEEVRQGSMKPNKIYLLSAKVESFGIETPQTHENSMNRTFYDSRTGDFTIHESYNLRPNHNNKIHNNINYPVLSSQSESRQDKDRTDDTQQSIDDYYELIKDNISYSDLAVSRPRDMKLVDEFIAIIVDTLMTESKTVRIGGEDKLRALVTGQLMKLNYDDIELVIDQFKAVTDRISKKKQYILTMLYNAKLEGDSHYVNAARSDIFR